MEMIGSVEKLFLADFERYFMLLEGPHDRLGCSNLAETVNFQIAGYEPDDSWQFPNDAKQLDWLFCDTLRHEALLL